MHPYFLKAWFSTRLVATACSRYKLFLKEIVILTFCQKFKLRVKNGSRDTRKGSRYPKVQDKKVQLIQIIQHYINRSFDGILKMVRFKQKFK